MSGELDNATGEASVVTGAFGYTGKYIAWKLLVSEQRVKTLTAHPRRENPFGGRIEIAPLNFDDRAGLVKALRGASVLYNTYWVRFEHGKTTFAGAVENTRKLIAAAREAQSAGEIRKEVGVRQLAFEIQALAMGANWSSRLFRDQTAFRSAHAAIQQRIGQVTESMQARE